MHLPDDGLRAPPFPSPSRLPGDDIRNAEMLSEFMSGHMISKRLLIACVTTLIYDILITEGQSIQFTYSLRGLSAVKVLFQVYRCMSAINFTLYFYLVEFMKPELCDLLSASEKVMSVNLAIVEVILLLRVWVLYERSRLVGVRLLALAVLGALSIVLVRIQKPDAPIKCVVPPPRDVTICPMPRPDELFYEYAIIAAVHVISLFLVVWKSLSSWSDLMNTPLVYKFIIDGVSYYVVITAVFVASVIAMTDERIALPFMESHIAICLSSIACNRLLLSLSSHSNSIAPVAPAQQTPEYQLQTFRSVEAGPSTNTRRVDESRGGCAPELP